MEKQYSDWLKIDLHIHTDWSKKTKDNDYKGIFTTTTLHEKLKENQVGIFSLTDHNIINLPAYEEYYKNYNVLDSPLLLIGVELDIELDTESNKRGYHTLLIFKESNIEKATKLNDKLERKYLTKGISNEKDRRLTITDIVEIFYEDEFFFIPHANNGGDRSITETYKGNIKDAQKMILLMPSALEKVPEEVIHIYNHGFDKVLNNSFRSKEDIAYINFSDNHFIDQYPCKHNGSYGNHEFYYIKGSKSYETLRLAFIDPKSRLKTNLEYKTIDYSNNIIEKIKISNDTLVSDCEIIFSPHLNVIIGGRSSGKSLLMNLLGKKIDKVEIEDKYKVGNENVQIKALRDDGYKSNTSLTHKLIYINQGDIVRYFEKKELRELAKEANKYSDYNERKEEFKERKLNVKEKVDELINAYNSVIEIGEDRKYILHKSTIDHILNEKFIFKLDYDKLNEHFDNSIKIDGTIKLIDELKVRVQEFKLRDVLDLQESDTSIINQFEELLETKLVSISNKKIINQNRVEFIEETKNIVASVNDTLDTDAKEKSKALESIVKLKEHIGIRFQTMYNLKCKCDSLELFDYSLKRLIELNEDVSLVLEVDNEYALKDYILDCLNNANYELSLYSNIIELLAKKKGIKNYNDYTVQTLIKKTNTVLEHLYKRLDEPKDYLEYKDGGTSQENSPGYNSEKYLEIILQNKDNKMVFIDQPEDNLGNKFIANNLVDIIRKIKFEKQLFLVTHNPSIVVYGDAECILIAKNNNNKISYKQIVLEDPDAQKEICGILDGGEYIFNNRSLKYNIQRILKEEE